MTMLQELLTRKKDGILGRWLDLVFATYAQDSIPLLRDRQDPFANPVGSTIRRELENLFDGLIAGRETKEMSHSLDAIVRIRAVQDFKPSEAVRFVIDLKRAIREECGDAVADPDFTSTLSKMESRIDELALTAFDLYMTCREQIADIKVGEARAEKDRLLRVVQAMGKEKD